MHPPRPAALACLLLLAAPSARARGSEFSAAATLGSAASGTATAGTATPGTATSASATPTPAPEHAPPAGLSASDWASVRDAREAARHQVFAAAGVHRARNPGQRWTSEFDGRGVTTTPDAGGWSWGLELVSYGWDEPRRALERPRRVEAEGNRVAYRWDARLEEWYVNDERGLEHGFTVLERADGARGPLTLELSVRGGLVAEVVGEGRDVRFVDGTGGTAVTYSGLVVLDAEGRALRAGWRAREGSLELRIEDQDTRYPLTIDPLAQQAYLKASNTNAGDWFGYCVALSGDTLVVGAPLEGPDSGAAYVFVRSGPGWSQQAYLKASNAEPGDWFGGSVALSGDTLVVGAHQEDGGATGVGGNEADNGAFWAGAAYVFVRSGGTWSQQAYLKASNTDAGDHFADSVSISGDTLVVGAPGEDSSATGVGGDQGDWHPDFNSGAAYVFVRAGTTWSQQAYVKASNTHANDGFGGAVSISGDTLAVAGRDNAASAGGAVHVLVRSGAAWGQQAYLRASNVAAGDDFGRCVSLSGDTLVVGAPLEDSAATGVGGDASDDSANDAGAAYVFVRSGASWSQHAYLKSSNTQAADQFGISVSLSGDALAVGVRHASVGAGAVCFFVRSGGSWSQDAYLQASNAEAHDHFGFSVSLAGGSLVVGAPHEDGSATGVDGDAGDNGALESGAAYVVSIATSGTITPFCFGDGTQATPCPCGNRGAPGRGCASSQVPAGARLDASGTTTPDTLVLTASDLLPSALSIFLQGNLPVHAGLVFGDGVRCAGGQLLRLAAKNAVAGVARFPEPGEPSISARAAELGAPIPAGGTRYYQTYYRDPSAMFCPPPAGNTWNVTQGVTVVW